jgi:uncharacterized membrane protein
MQLAKNDYYLMKRELKKIVGTLAILLTYCLLNYFVRIHLPGVSNVDIRPQIVLLFVAGYLYGPYSGFIAGFAGNVITDLLLGYGFTYLPSWSVANGLIGCMMGLFPYRKLLKLDRIRHLELIVLFIIIANIVSLAYAAVMMNILGIHLSTDVNFNYFYLPALLSNIIGSLVFFPVILLLLGHLKKNFPVKTSLLIYYLTIFLILASWIIFALNFIAVSEKISFSFSNVLKGNAMVDAFNHWSLLLVVMLIVGFFISGWLSKTVVTPIKHLEDTVNMVLKGKPESSDILNVYAKREDEIGILSYAVKLLSEKLWETQRLFRDELKNKMKFIDKDDSATDVFIVSLVSMFGREVLNNSESEMFSSNKGEISNISALCLLVSSGGLKELAATYSEAKIGKSLEEFKLETFNAKLSKEERQALALAIDLNLLFKGRLLSIDLRDALDYDFSYHLLENVQAFRKSDKKYVGYITENDIISKLQSRWDSSGKVRSERLETAMKSALSKQILKGYHIKNKSDIANFNEDLKIIYSHSNFKHIKQLMGLLVSENFQAKIQLEPKHSSFIYLDEWERTPDINLESTLSGFSIAHKNEFDVVMEFASKDQRDRFYNIIGTFAKRESSGEQNILYESWYQPLFCSEVPVDGYYKISNLSIEDESHVVHTYCKEQEYDAVKDWFNNESTDFCLSATPLWVNDAFYRYLEGGFE